MKMEEKETATIAAPIAAYGPLAILRANPRRAYVGSRLRAAGAAAAGGRGGGGPAAGAGRVAGLRGPLRRGLGRPRARGPAGPADGPLPHPPEEQEDEDRHNQDDPDQEVRDQVRVLVPVRGEVPLAGLHVVVVEVLDLHPVPRGLGVVELRVPPRRGAPG